MRACGGARRGLRRRICAAARVCEVPSYMFKVLLKSMRRWFICSVSQQRKGGGVLAFIATVYALCKP